MVEELGGCDDDNDDCDDGDGDGAVVDEMDRCGGREKDKWPEIMAVRAVVVTEDEEDEEGQRPAERWADSGAGT